MDDSHKMVDIIHSPDSSNDIAHTGNLLNKRLGKAIIKIPILALTTIGNLFKLKGAYKNLSIQNMEKAILKKIFLKSKRIFIKNETP